MTIRAVVFDLGHTIWDIKRDDIVMAALERAYVEMRVELVARLRREDLPEAVQLQHAVRDVLHEYVTTYENSDDLSQPPTHTFVAQGLATVGVTPDEETLRAITPPIFATEIDALICSDGTCEAIADLAADGYAMGCITNTLAGEAAIREMLERWEIGRHMSSVVVSAEEGWRKPHWSLFEKSLRELRVEPEEALFVGDSPVHDIAGAKAVGIHAALTQQYVARDYAAFDPQPDAVIQHVREVRDVIRRLESVPARRTG